MTVSRFTPLILDQKTRLKNRLVLPPMASQTADIKGQVTTETLKHYARLSLSGAGLLMVEYSFVSLDGRSEPNQLGVHDDRCITGLAKLVNVLKQGGARAGIQLTHCGGKTTPDVTSDMMGPSGLAVPAYDRDLIAPRAMTRRDIVNWEQAFMRAAGRAAEAGFDFVELHCAHGYGLNQWLSPLTNQRDDRYGGCLENRALIVLNIVRGIRQFHPNLKIMVRVPGQDGYPAGLSQKEMAQVCQWLADAGATIIDVSSGIGGWKRPKERRGEGYLVEEAAFLKPKLNVPVIGVGGIETAEYMEKALSSGWLDLVAVGRAILKDPAAFDREQMQPSEMVA